LSAASRSTSRLRRTALALLAGACVAWPALAQQPTSQELGSSHRPRWQADRNAWKALGEVTLSNAVVWGFNRYLRESGQNPGFRIGLNSFEENFKNGYEWDDNNFGTNQWGHPFQGNLYFNAGRVNGFSYWESMPYAFFGSFQWEYFGEIHHPAINDWISTSLGGAALGEVFWRFSTHVLDNTATGGERAWREFGGFLLNPVRAFDRLVTGRAFEQFPNPPSRDIEFEGASRLGMRTTGRENLFQSHTTRMYLDFDFEYRDPFGTENEKPFDTFDAKIQVNFADVSPLGDVRVAGLLWSTDMSKTDRSHHRIGIAHRFDYVNNSAYEWGGQAFTGGVMSRFQVSERSQFTSSFSGGTMLMAGTKSDYENFTGRSYDYGPGVLLEYKGILMRDERPLFTISHQTAWVHIVNGNDADHVVTVTRAALDLPVRHWFGAGFEYVLYTAERTYADFDDVSERNPEFRTYLRWGL